MKNTQKTTKIRNKDKLKQTKLPANYTLNSPVHYGQRRKLTNSSQDTTTTTTKTKQHNEIFIKNKKINKQPTIHQSTQSQSAPQPTCFPIGIDIDSQSSTLHYHRIHPKEKIKQLNRNHGGWLESKEQPQAEDDDCIESDQVEVHQTISPANSVDCDKIQKDESNQVLEDNNTNDHPLVKPQHGSNNLIISQNHIEQVGTPREHNQLDGFSQVQRQDENTNDMSLFNHPQDDSTSQEEQTHQESHFNYENPESILPFPTQKNEACSGAIFFDDGYLEPETQSQVQVHRKEEQDCRDDTEKQVPCEESYLYSQTQNLNQPKPFAIFFDSQYLSTSKNENESFPNHHHQHHQSSQQICNNNSDQIESNKKSRILAEDTQEELLSIKRKVLVEDTQDQSSQKGSDLGNRSLAPPTPIATRRRLITTTPKVGDNNNLLKSNFGRCPSSSSSSVTLVNNDNDKQQQQVYKKRKKDHVNVPPPPHRKKKISTHDHFIAAWSTPPEFKILKPDSSKTFRQINLTEFLDPIQPSTSSSTTKSKNEIINTNEKEEEERRHQNELEKKIIHSHLSILSRHSQTRPCFSKLEDKKDNEMNNIESEEEEEEEIDDDDDDSSSCSIDLLRNKKIPDSLPPSDQGSSSTFQFNNNNNNNNDNNNNNEMISKFQDRIDRIAIRKSIYHQVFLHDTIIPQKKELGGDLHNDDDECQTDVQNQILGNNTISPIPENSNSNSNSQLQIKCLTSCSKKTSSNNNNNDDDDDEESEEETTNGIIDQEEEDGESTSGFINNESNSNILLLTPNKKISSSCCQDREDGNDGEDKSIDQLHDSHPIFNLDNLIKISKFIIDI